jgi:glucose/arabinose dehydrogenase
MVKAFGFISILSALGIIANNHFTAPSEKDQPAVLNYSPMATPEENYRNFCSGCHGEKMDAFVDRKWKHGKTAQDLFKAIKLGYPDEGMPGFDSAFTDDQISDLVDYIITGIQNVSKYDFKDSLRSNIFKSQSMTVKLDTVISGINVPWGMAFLPHGEMLVTDRGGKLYRVDSKRKMHEISGVPQVVAEGQGGLMDVELHPDFKNNSVVYLSYSMGKTSDKGALATTAIMKAKLKGNALVDGKNIFEAQPFFRTRHHYGSRMEFGKDGYLYFTVGDRGNHNQFPQNLDSHPGKVHRIKDDGSIPSDNPFVKDTGALASIFSYGHRNLQGMTRHPQTGDIWTHEHGPRGGDEINIIKKGRNYGWPVISYGINYDGTVLTSKTSMKGMEQPLHYWIPSIGPSGMAFVTGKRYKAWQGHLLVGSLRFKYLNLCRISGNKVVKEEILLKNIGRVRDVRMGPDGYIYVSVENPGAIFRLIPTER